MLLKDQSFVLCDGKLRLAERSPMNLPLDENIQRSISITHLLNNPFSVYILNELGETLLINDFGAKVCGFKTPVQSVGKSLFDVSQEDAAHTLIQNSQHVIKTQALQIFDEVNVRKDNEASQFLSIKLPWYTLNNKLMGSVGFSIVLGKNNLSQSLSKLVSLGLLGAMPPPFAPGGVIKPSGINLTLREQQCLELSLKHYTAKQIAKSLSLSYRTVEEYLSNLKQKFGVATKQELIQKAFML